MQEFLFEVLICFLAGAGAGLGTGFAGMSAATVISPMLVTFLGLPAYDAIGIALASDVLASAVSARTYAKSGALDIKNGLVMMAGVLSMTMVGSWLSTFMPNNTLGGFSVVMTLILGLRFLLLPVTSPNRTIQGSRRWVQIVKGAAGGAAIGLVCGFFGAGGGMMMLMLLTMLLGYELKTAVGTSVFVMTFSALTGAVSHFALGSPPRMDLLILCVIFTLLWAQIAAKIATRADAKLLNRLTGAILTILGVILAALNFF
ncbi:transporter [Gemmiger sp. An120]|uniref:sulfite exporter TauE/SafE family protein n=1 Tax=Gemmiger sp. An120 TaxID=1965549 RepID=UPI000B38C039|nr:sulfite exporter TauE/SafE family protein [Gemmiger sp. An120]OUQ42192.1 transporter [Gemmiger sp. An120]